MTASHSVLCLLELPTPGQTEEQRKLHSSQSFQKTSHLAINKVIRPKHWQLLPPNKPCAAYMKMIYLLSRSVPLAQLHLSSCCTQASATTTQACLVVSTASRSNEDSTAEQQYCCHIPQQYCNIQYGSLQSPTCSICTLAIAACVTDSTMQYRSHTLLS